jgi:hypothetical protein
VPFSRDGSQSENVCYAAAILRLNQITPTTLTRKFLKKRQNNVARNQEISQTAGTTVLAQNCQETTVNSFFFY